MHKQNYELNIVYAGMNRITNHTSLTKVLTDLQITHNRLRRYQHINDLQIIAYVAIGINTFIYYTQSYCDNWQYILYNFVWYWRFIFANDLCFQHRRLYLNVIFYCLFLRYINKPFLAYFNVMTSKLWSKII
jgi:hypothetical protein